MKESCGYKIAFSICFVGIILLTVTAFTYKNSVLVEESETEELLYWQEAIIYQVNVLSFLDTDADGYGDIQGITSKVDYFLDLGIDIIWISPIFSSPMKDFGYDISNYTEIDPLFGTMQDFEKMVTVMHRNGIKVVLDWVPNHTSDQHEWFQKSVKRESPYEDYYVWKDCNETDPHGNRIPPNNWISVFRNSAWEWSEERQQFYLHQFLKEQPDLNLRNPSVLKDLEASMRFWLDKGVDGFRVDAAKHFYEVEDVYGADEPVANANSSDPNDYSYLNHTLTTDQPETFDLLRSWRTLIDEYSDKLFMVEVYNPNISGLMPYYGTEDQPLADFPMNFDLIDSLSSRENVSGYSLKAIVDRWLDNMPAGKWPNWVLGNHDKKRISSRVGPDLVDSLNMFCLLLPGTPITYQGEEIGMQNTEISYEETKDPSGCAYGPERYQEFSRDPERTPMQWDDSDFAGFTKGSKPWLPVNPNYVTRNVNAQKNASQSSYKVYQELAKLRKEEAFRAGQLAFPVVSDEILAFLRYIDGKNRYLIAINTSKNEKVVDLTHDKNFNLPSSAEIIIRSSTDSRETTQPGSTIELNSIPMYGGEGIIFVVPPASTTQTTESAE